jgi:hypothetical protein
MWYWTIFAIAMFAGIAMTVREGIWSNTLTLVNTIISGLVAFGFFSPIVTYLDQEPVTEGQHTYWLDFCVVWALFCATMVIARSLTAACSKTRLRFKNPIDPVGGPIVGCLVAWVMATIILSTLHMSPMPKDAFNNKLVYDANSASIMSQPDLAWLRFVERMSKPGMFGSASGNEFSAKAFVDIYTDRRAKFDKAPSLIVKRGT